MKNMFFIGFSFNLLRFLLGWHIYDQTDAKVDTFMNITEQLVQTQALSSVKNNVTLEVNPILNQHIYQGVQLEPWNESQYKFAHLLLEAISITLPFLSLSFPFCWIVANYSALAQLLATFCSMRHVKITEDPFEDTVERPDILQDMSRENTSMSWRNYKAYFISGFFGKGEYLSRTENIVHTLGSLSSLCCTDKKGILSWPNTSAEKIFLLKNDEQPNKKVSIAVSYTHLTLPTNREV